MGLFKPSRKQFQQASLLYAKNVDRRNRLENERLLRDYINDRNYDYEIEPERPKLNVQAAKEQEKKQKYLERFKNRKNYIQNKIDETNNNIQARRNNYVQ